MEQIQVRVVDESLWNKFHPDTEMILTKKGRSLFPKLEYIVSGLNPDTYYAFQLHMRRVDDIKYKFDQGMWTEASKGEPRIAVKSIRHSEGFRRGEDWMRGNVSFYRLKITNNPAETRPTHIVLQSMHKYIPVLTIVKMCTMYSEQNYQMPLESSESREYEFPFTQFIAVTAYQNHEITQLKVAHNKYARGFRAENTRKRMRVESPEDEIQQKPHKMQWTQPMQPQVYNPAFYNPMMPSTMIGAPLTPPDQETEHVNAYENGMTTFDQFNMAAYYGYGGYNNAGFQYYPQGYSYIPQMNIPQGNAPAGFDQRATSVDISPNSSYHSP